MMTADKAPTRFQVTLGSDGDIRLGTGGTQEFLPVEIHSSRKKQVSYSPLLRKAKGLYHQMRRE